MGKSKKKKNQNKSLEAGSDMDITSDLSNCSTSKKCKNDCR